MNQAAGRCLCFFMYMCACTIGGTGLQPCNSSHRHSPWPPFVFPIDLRKTFRGAFAECSKLKWLQMRSFLRHGKGFVPLRTQLSLRVMENSASACVSRKKLKLLKK